MGQELIPSWVSGGRVLWLCVDKCYQVLFYLQGLTKFLLIARVSCTEQVVSYEVIYFFGCSQLRHPQWSDADRVEVRFCGHLGDQAQVGSVVVRIRSEVRGP